MIFRLLYTALLYLYAPVLFMRMLWRGTRDRGYLEHWDERFGASAKRRPALPVIWVHAVSVGETRAAAPLIRELRKQYAGHAVLLTHMTPTGRRTALEIYGDDVTIAYLPYDYPFAVARFLRHYEPRIGVLMETEIWPNLVHACHDAEVPLYLVNARLSERSFARYRRVLPLASSSIHEFAAIGAQSDDDAHRFAALGAQRLAITGNIKFDVEPPRSQVDLGNEWRAGWARPVLLAASTRDGEEALLLDALANADLQGALIVIVPRHPHRFDEVAELLQRRGYAFRRRSRGVQIARDTQVLLGDSMGEMFAYYASCDAAFVGGSLLPYGGQNLIEPCALGKPVLIGPHTYNFAEASVQACKAGAALRVDDAESLLRAAGTLLVDAGARAAMGNAALAFSQAHRGATRRTVELLRF